MKGIKQNSTLSDIELLLISLTDSEYAPESRNKIYFNLFLKIKNISENQKLLEHVIYLFSKKKESGHDLFNAIISMYIFDDINSIKEHNGFIENLAAINKNLDKRIEIVEKYIDKRQAIKVMHKVYNEFKKSKEEFNHYKNNLLNIGLKVDTSFIYADTLRSNTVSNESWFIAKEFGLLESSEKFILLDLLCFADQFGLNTNLKKYLESIPYPEQFTINSNDYNVIMLLLAKLEIENKKSENSALLRIKSYPKEFITKLIEHKKIRYDDIALSEIKKNKFNPFTIYPEIWFPFLTEKNNEKWIDLFDNEAIFNPQLNFYHNNNVIESCLNVASVSVRPEKLMLILNFLKEIKSNPFEEKDGNLCFFNDLIKTIDKYQRESFIEDYILVTQLFLDKFKPDRIFLETEKLKNESWKSYLETIMLNCSLKDNKSEIKNSQKRL